MDVLENGEITMPKIDFSNIKHEMEHTWNSVASDVLGPEEARTSMRRSEVIDIVLDQMYNVTYKNIPTEEMEAFKALSSNQRKKLAREVFTYKTYGW